jgi:hypothetical protein
MQRQRARGRGRSVAGDDGTLRPDPNGGLYSIGVNDRAAQGHAVGDVTLDELEQHLDGVCHAMRRGEYARPVCRLLVDDREPGAGRGAMPGIGLAGEPGGEDDPGALLPAQEAVVPGRVVRRKTVAGDRDQAAAIGETGERRADVLERGGAVSARHRRRGRERRVHEHNARPQLGRQVVMDLLGVVPGDGHVREKPRQKPGAGRGDLVERQRGAGHPREHGEQADPGRGFQDKVAGADLGGPRGDGTKRDRRGELLELLGLLRAPGLARQARGQPRQHREQVGGCGCPGGHGRAELLEEQDLGNLDRIIGVLPHPGAFGVGGAEGLLHGATQEPGVEDPALLEQAGEDGPCMKKPRHLVRGLGGKEGKRRPLAGRASGGRHRGSPRAGNGRPTGARSLSVPPGFARSRPSLSLSRSSRAPPARLAARPPGRSARRP